MISILNGDITCIPVDAIVTSANPGGTWAGGVDKAIIRAAGDRYHAQLSVLVLNGLMQNGTIFYAHGGTKLHRGAFKDVVFVCDDVHNPLPLYNLVFGALAAARAKGCKSVAIPAFRTGAATRYFPNQAETIGEIACACHDFHTLFPDMVILFVGQALHTMAFDVKLKNLATW